PSRPAWSQQAGRRPSRPGPPRPAAPPAVPTPRLVRQPPSGGRAPADTGGGRARGGRGPGATGGPGRPGGGPRGRGGRGSTQGAFGRGGKPARSRKSKRAKRQEFEQQQAPAPGGVSIPRGNGQTIRLRRGASLSDFADRIDVNPASLIT